MYIDCPFFMFSKSRLKFNFFQITRLLNNFEMSQPDAKRAKTDEQQEMMQKIVSLPKIDPDPIKTLSI